MSARQVKAGGAFVEVGLRSSIAKGARKIKKELRAVSQSLRTVGTGAQAAGAAVAAPLISGLAGVATIFGSFQHKMSEVRAITNASGKDFDRLTAKAKELGASTQFSAGQAAEAMKFLGMAGYDTDQILAGIGPTLQLAAAGGLELATAADIASDVSSAFNLAASDIGRVADVLAATATASNTSVEMMGEAFKYAAPLASAAGQSIEQTSAALGTLANSGIKATVAGTDIAGILKSMGDNKDGLSELGIAIADSEGNMRSIIDVMSDFGLATSQMTQEERLGKATALFGRYAKSALVLSSNIPAMEELKQKLDSATGSAEKMAAVMKDDLYGSYKSLMSAAEGLVIALGGGAEGMLRTILDTTTKVIRQVTTFLQENKEVARQIATIAIVAATAGVALFTFGSVVVALGAVVASVSTIFGAFSSVAGSLAAVFNPITLAVVALAGVYAYAAYESGLLGEAFDWLKVKFFEILATAKLALGGIYDALSAGQYQLAVKILWAGIKLGFMQGANAVADALVYYVRNWFSIMERFYGSILKMTYRVAMSLPQLLIASMTGQQQAVSKILKAIFTGEFDGGQFFDTSAQRRELNDLVEQAKKLRSESDRRNQQQRSRGLTGQQAFARVQQTRQQLQLSGQGFPKRQAEQIAIAAGTDNKLLEQLGRQQLQSLQNLPTEVQGVKKAIQKQGACKVFTIGGIQGAAS